MTPNKRDLKAYARFDGTGRIVPGSLVLRRTEPKVGTWNEIQAYECCNPSFTTEIVYSSNPGGTIDVGVGFGINCTGGAEYIISYFISYPTEINTTQELVDYLNIKFAGIATFNVINSTTISTTFSNVIANSICPSGTLTIVPYYAA
jgi:hypothetical protein